VIELWSGARIVRRLPSLDAISGMTDDEVARTLRGLDALVANSTAAERRTRLLAWPTPADLDSIAVAWTPGAGGVRPVVRVLEVAWLGGRRSPAGTVPA